MRIDHESERHRRKDKNVDHAARSSLFPNAANPPLEGLCNCLSGQVLEGGGEINEFMGSCPLLIKFSSHGSINHHSLRMSCTKA